MATALIDQGVQSLLDAVLSGKVYANLAPQNARAPFVTFHRISGQKIRHINGPSGLAQTVFQVDVYADANLESRQISDSIRLALDGYKGTVTIGADSVRIGGVSMQAERDFIESSVDPKLYRSSVDYLFIYEEDV